MQRIDVASLKAVRTGLRLKSLGSSVLLIGLVVSVLSFSPWVWLTAACVTMGIDLAGRMLCLRAPVPGPKSIRWSVAAQATGLILLLFLSLFGKGWMLAGFAVAVICQISAARWFVRFLAELADSIGRPDLADRIIELRIRLNLFASSLYGAGFSSLVIAAAAIFFGLMSFGIGFVFSIPIGGMAIILIFLMSMGVYLRMLVVYREVIRSVGEAVGTAIERAGANGLVTGPMSPLSDDEKG